METALVVLAALAAGVLATLSRARRRRAAQPDRSALARAVGGVVEEPSSDIVVTRGGHELRVTLGEAPPNTRIHGAAPQAGEVMLRVRPEGPRSLAESLGGLPDIRTGEPRFDDSFFVTTDDEDLARLWLDRELCARFLPLGPTYRLRLAVKLLLLERDGLEDDPNRLAAALDLGFAILWRGNALAQSWHALSTELGVAPKAPLRVLWPGPDTAIDASVDRVPVRVELVREPGRSGLWRCWRTSTGIRAERSGGEEFVVERQSAPPTEDALAELDVPALAGMYRVRSRVPAQTAGRLDAETCAELGELAPARVRADRTAVTVEISGVELGVERLRGLMALAARLARHQVAPRPAGPYR
jgi:hypothetical protein